MKKLAAILCVSALTTGAFAQGLINFFNNANTLVSSGTPGSEAAISGAAGSYYFALLTSGVGAGQFTFANVLGTNQTVAGRFFGGASVPVSGWAAGTAKDFEVAGWSASLGTTFNPAWLTGSFGGASGFFGVSSVGTGQAGGSTATGTLPNLNIFGGATGIQNGFNLTPTNVPEPSSMALAGLGAAALLIFRRRK